MSSCLAFNSMADFTKALGVTEAIQAIEVASKMLSSLLTHQQYFDVVRHPSTTAG